ncbi:MAG: phage tail sheath subtilisin-like domain-containing protein [Mitsuaria chitosanitabida]|uniref:phage tail sheath family protein n=1 Tax=Roseateles chitosanitabidus TaxID=65048 RepID=UPI001B0DD0FF|nr:phage tail sheath C-terminal domain-containing protein [Roseateles chitosanitabidus]MBO9689433.1 phage tail sheath subtilisin-like domain-containing protein [Roseateles chitosanitabidus]
MAVMKTPGVYIVEKNAFPNSVVEVATAVPAFIGHTEYADNRNVPLAMKPWRISSMAEYHQFFGGPPKPVFKIAAPADGQSADFQAVAERDKDPQGFVIQQADGVEGGRFGLYQALRHFYQNGGGPCYIVSVGTYKDELDKELMTKGIDELLKEQEPTMVLVPEAVSLKTIDDCKDVQQAMLAHCGGKMRSRIAILDIYNGDKALNDNLKPVDTFRDKLGINYLDFSVAYYPWLNTSIVGEKELSFENIHKDSIATLKSLMLAELRLDAKPAEDAPARDKAMADAIAGVDTDFEAQVKAAFDEQKKTDPKAKDPTPDQIKAGVLARKALLNKTLSSVSGVFNTVLNEARRHLNVMPPGPAMAGIYTMVDNSRGVWKAPANVSLSGVISPTVSISAEQQEDLNVTAQGKSINAIRSFIGEGVLVWGARTLDGNSLDWRYVNVRRTMIMLEESCKLAAKALVFEPNTANTWVTIKSMIANFLTGIWKRGGLMGAVPEDAFSVHVGLGETMTPDDVLEGILRVTVLVAMVRPAEFIEITFQQQMPKS